MTQSCILWSSSCRCNQSWNRRPVIAAALRTSVPFHYQQIHMILMLPILRWVVLPKRFVYLQVVLNCREENQRHFPILLHFQTHDDACKNKSTKKISVNSYIVQIGDKLLITSNGEKSTNYSIRSILPTRLRENPREDGNTIFHGARPKLLRN